MTKKQFIYTVASGVSIRIIQKSTNTEETMIVRKNGMSFTGCDLCGDILKYSRAGKNQTYDESGISVCSRCCNMPPTVESLDTRLVQFFINLYKKTKSTDFTFWPIDNNHTKAKIQHLKALT